MASFTLRLLPCFVVAGAGAGCFSPETGMPRDLAGDSSGSETGGTTLGSGISEAESTTAASTTADTESSEDDTSGEPAESSSTTSPDATTTGVPEPACGDGFVDDGEECDDGNDEDADACSNACVAGFYTGTSDPCAAFGQTLCGYFEAECRVAPGEGALHSLCYWPLTDEAACAATAGIWTPSDGPFAMGSGFDFPTDGACITQLSNIDCSAADAQSCADAGATLCFREVGPRELPNLCWWDLDEAGCVDIPGIWTTADSGFGENHPHALAPSGAAACILQVSAL